MAQTETRHAERTSLYRLLMADYTGSAKREISEAIASMEKEDVDAVIQEFERWKNSEKK